MLSLKALNYHASIPLPEPMVPVCLTAHHSASILTSLNKLSCFWSKNFRPNSLIDFSFQSTVQQGMKCCLQAMRRALPVIEVITSQMREMLSSAFVRHAQQIPQIMWLLFLRLTVTSVSMTLGFPHTFIDYFCHLFVSMIFILIVIDSHHAYYLP